MLFHLLKIPWSKISFNELPCFYFSDYKVTYRLQLTRRMSNLISDALAKVILQCILFASEIHDSDLVSFIFHSEFFISVYKSSVGGGGGEGSSNNSRPLYAGYPVLASHPGGSSNYWFSLYDLYKLRLPLLAHKCFYGTASVSIQKYFKKYTCKYYL